MRRSLAVTLLCAASLAAADRGLPARSSAADYPAQESGKQVTLAAEYMPRDQVTGSFSTDLSRYVVFEVAVYPANGKSLDVSHLDFALKADGRTVRPVNGRAIAGSNQRRGQARSKDILLFPTIGLTTGSWGTGTSVGVGAATGGGPPGPASTDRDRDVMQQEIDDRILPEVTTNKPVAGYLFFPVSPGRRRPSSYVLEYNDGTGAEVRIAVPASDK
ncbi:MAG TPA: hypothetical protein VES20_09625 [Bryobacteraceae bacterium]|nr:hypothetical protein [Bryobacteraceae bacterium]